MKTKLTDDKKREKRNARQRYNTAAGNARRVTEGLLQAIDAVLAQPGPITNKKNLEEIRAAATDMLGVLPEGKQVLTEKSWRALEELFNLTPSPFPGSK